jgi:hypothetical protein
VNATPGTSDRVRLPRLSGEKRTKRDWEQEPLETQSHALSPAATVRQGRRPAVQQYPPLA